MAYPKEKIHEVFFGFVDQFLYLWLKTNKWCFIDGCLGWLHSEQAQILTRAVGFFKFLIFHTDKTLLNFSAVFIFLFSCLADIVAGFLMIPAFSFHIGWLLFCRTMFWQPLKRSQKGLILLSKVRTAQHYPDKTHFWYWDYMLSLADDNHSFSPHQVPGLGSQGASMQVGALSLVPLTAAEVPGLRV